MIIPAKLGQRTLTNARVPLYADLHIRLSTQLAFLDEASEQSPWKIPIPTVSILDPHEN